MAKLSAVEHIKNVALPLLDSLGIELVELEYRKEGHGMVLRLFIDKPDGIMLDDCAAVSRELSELLDIDEVIDGHYNLEVSSPGLCRPLTKEADYERYAGRLVKIKTFEMLADVAGNKRKTFLGELLGLSAGIVSLKLVEGQTAEVPLDKIAKANLEFEM